jgi:hypothetical protein
MDSFTVNTASNILRSDVDPIVVAVFCKFLFIPGPFVVVMNIEI